MAAENYKILCDSCGVESVLRSRYFDAYVCLKCKNWIEDRCADELCSFCKNRPDKPLFTADGHLV